jgi:co-chaperonin GroES (HSP10)
VFNPVNRHILVGYAPPQEKTDSGILLPDDYKPPTEDYLVVDVLAVADGLTMSLYVVILMTKSLSTKRCYRKLVCNTLIIT